MINRENMAGWAIVVCALTFPFIPHKYLKDIMIVGAVGGVWGLTMVFDHIYDEFQTLKQKLDYIIKHQS